MAAAIEKSTVRLIAFSAFYLFFLLVGAAVFSAIESPLEEDRLQRLKSMRQQFLNDRQACLTEQDLDDFVSAVIEAQKAGVMTAKNMTNAPNWSFGQSIFFATSLLTTIGYGHVSPLSGGGKIFCVIYTAVGIPLTLILFSVLVDRLMRVSSLLLTALMSGLSHVMFRALYVRIIHVALLFCFVLVVVFLIPSAVFTIVETDWDFLDSFYYCFISMTTVGLVYLFFGLVLMLLLVANICEIPELNVGKYFSVRGVSSGNQGDGGEPVTIGHDIQTGVEGEYRHLDPAGSEQPRYTATASTGGHHSQRKVPEDKRRLTDE